jgi:hypothetical protein
MALMYALRLQMNIAGDTQFNCALAHDILDDGLGRSYKSDLCCSANRSRLLVPRSPSFWQMLTR